MANSTITESRKKLSTIHSKDTVHCLLLPLQDIRLLLPNTAVAEVIGYTLPEALEDVPEWFSGYITWREVKVPLLSFEGFSGEGQQQAGARRIAVLNTLNGNPRLPYLAIMLQGIPQLRLINEDSLAQARVEDEAEGVAARIDISGERVLVPDLDCLEQQLLKHI